MLPQLPSVSLRINNRQLVIKGKHPLDLLEVMWMEQINSFVQACSNSTGVTTDLHKVIKRMTKNWFTDKQEGIGFVLVTNESYA